MKIKELKIHNWRSIADISMDFEKLMIFIGQNNHGKSNILSAILFFFGEISLCEKDYRKGSKELWVEIEFDELDDHDKSQFRKYLTHENTIKVRKVANTEDGFSYHGYKETPKEKLLREEICIKYTSREKAKKLPFFSLLPQEGRILQDDIRKALFEFLESKDDIEYEYILEETKFLCYNNIAQGIFGNILFIPSLKDTLDELNLKGSSVFNKILSVAIQEMSENNPVYKEAKGKMLTLTQTLNKNLDDGTKNKSRPKELANLEDRLEKELSTWNTKIDIEITPPDINEIFKLGTEVIVDDGVKTGIEYKGHGLQRSLLFALIKSWSEISQEIEQQKGTKETGRRTSSSSFIIIEEPELYLHPQAQREFFSSLKQLSEKNHQVIITTHSSFFLDLSLYKSICIVRKNGRTSPTEIFQCREDLFKELNDKKTFNLIYWINPERGEIFFSEKTILVEGQTEKTIIPYIADKLGIFKHGYSLIDCGSKESIPIYEYLLNKFNIEYVVVYDKDHQSSKTKEQITLSDQKSKQIEDSINPTLGKSVVLENDIEEEIGLSKNGSKYKAFKALKKINEKGFSIPKKFEAKIKEIYS
jgi:CRISPR-associated exonuclease Cas4